MKYRSPSPLSDSDSASALPTPPHSPHAGVVVQRTAVATSLLDSLCSFYQQERYWVHHTRAALELALSKGIDAHAISLATADDASANSDNAPSPASSTTTLCDSPMQHAVTVKPDPDADCAEALLSPIPVDADSASARASRWLRRKNKMRLRLEGINSHPHRTPSAQNGWKRQHRPHKAPATEPGARLLEMFSELVDARMESCQRISRMVQESTDKRPTQIYC